MPNQNTFYIVPMFPYPSGRLHMGHVRNYTISDAIARHYRRQGYDVIHPIGWDAFGLPAENAAREKGVDPRVWTDQNIQSMKMQLIDMEFEFDTAHEIATHTPSYIAQGQAMFLRFYQAGLIERRSGEVWWDPVDQTVLANEQVVDGRGWRSGAIVERKTLSMLFAKTQAQGRSLADGLNHVEWPSAAIAAQRAWIGMDQTPVRLRDWCLSRQRSWGTPVPLIECPQCGEVPADIATLPLPNLPTKPTDADRACHCPICGHDALRSTETLDTFWDSSFYTYCYPDAHEGAVQSVAGKRYQRFGQVDLYVGGLEHATMHLLYARWFARAMKHTDIAVDEEPFKRLIGQGMVCAPAYRIYQNDQPGEWIAPCDVVFRDDGMATHDGQSVRYMGSVKMSKSKKNGVDPAQYVSTYGAEAVRFAMLFAAPYAVEVDWNEDVVRIAAGHLERMKDQADQIGSINGGDTDTALEQEADELAHMIIASFEGREGVNAMMGHALGVWRKSVRAAREGKMSSARIASLRVVQALWPIAPKAMAQVAQKISPGWTSGPVSRASGGRRSKSIVFQINGVKRGLIENEGFETEQEAWECVQRVHHGIIENFLPNGHESIIWVKDRVINVIAAKAPTPSVEPASR
jgi:leucyl-tRNA synthetase